MTQPTAYERLTQDTERATKSTTNIYGSPGFRSFIVLTLIGLGYLGVAGGAAESARGP